MNLQYTYALFKMRSGEFWFGHRTGNRAIQASAFAYEEITRAVYIGNFDMKGAANLLKTGQFSEELLNSTKAPKFEYMHYETPVRLHGEVEWSAPWPTDKGPALFERVWADMWAEGERAWTRDNDDRKIEEMRQQLQEAAEKATESLIGEPVNAMQFARAVEEGLKASETSIVCEDSDPLAPSNITAWLNRGPVTRE